MEINGKKKGNSSITVHVHSSRATVIFTVENKGTEIESENVKKQVSSAESKMAAQDLRRQI